MTGNHKPDYYAVLELPADAGAAEIRSAYRRLAGARHPDKNPNDARAQERFIELQQAYRVLSDPAERARYDRSLKSKGPANDLLQKSRSVIDSFVHNLREAAGSWPRRGRNRRYSLTLELPEAARGGRFQLEMENATLEVRVPAGVEDGTRLRIEGEGEPGTAGGKPGDLIVAIRIEPHPLLTRRGADLFCQVPVPLPAAVLGGSVGIPTLEGPRAFRLPAGTQSGQVIRLGGQGMPRPGGDGRGDLALTVRVEVPVGLSPEMEELFSRLAGTGGNRHYPEVTRYREVLDSTLNFR